MRIAFHTLGCKVNQYETEAMKEQFVAFGHDIACEDDFADVYIINTCTVTNLADRKSRQYIRKMKRVNPDAIVAVTGCYAQVNPEEVRLLEGVNIVAGTNEKNNLVTYVEDFAARQAERHARQNAQESGLEEENGFEETSSPVGCLAKRMACGDDRLAECYVLDYDDLDTYESSGIITSMESRTRAYIKIQEGCNRFCSYCIIPYARGKVRSRNLEEIVKEAEGLLAKGFKEIILTGINTALYGTDIGMGGIEPLIRRLNAIEGDFRIRLSSLEPTVINAEYVKELLKYEKLCNHLHLSIQSGSDNILKAMNRRYDRREYLDIVKILQEFDPCYGITTDIIVGFPGETQGDFEDSLAIIDEVGFCKVHAFKYSKRRGTKAADMPNQISGEEKNARSALLIEKAQADGKMFLARNVGQTRRVLFEEMTAGGLATGYTDNYIKVYVKGDQSLLNCFKNVKLLEEYKDGMKGEI